MMSEARESSGVSNWPGPPWKHAPPIFECSSLPQNLDRRREQERSFPPPSEPKKNPVIGKKSCGFNLTSFTFTLLHSSTLFSLSPFRIFHPHLTPIPSYLTPPSFDREGRSFKAHMISLSLSLHIDIYLGLIDLTFATSQVK